MSIIFIATCGEEKKKTSETETAPEEKSLSRVGRRKGYNLKGNVFNASMVLAISTSLERPYQPAASTNRPGHAGLLSLVQKAAVTPAADDVVEITESSVCTRNRRTQRRPRKQVYDGSAFRWAAFAKPGYQKRHGWVRPCTSVHAAHLSARENVPRQLNLGKVALSDGLEQPVVAHVRLLRLLGTPGSDASPGGARSGLLAAISVRRVLWNKTRRI